MAVNKSAILADLGAELRRLRTEAGLNVRDTGKLVGVSGAVVSFWERGERLIAHERLASLLKELDVADDTQERLLSLRRNVSGPAELLTGAASVDSLLAQLIDFEEKSKRIVHFELGMIPGLLQTGEYARAVIGNVPDANVKVKLRVGRSEILTRADPVELLALIDSEVLVRPVAPPAAMARQFEHLLRMQALPNVTIRIVPSTAPGFHPGLLGSFKVFGLSASSVVHVENYLASPFLWDEEFVAMYLEAARQIEEKAMTPDHTSEVIRQMLHGLETT